MINNIDELKAELIFRNIAYEDEMYGCSESEILQIEAKYGKLPLSYRQIISLIGHSAGFLTGDLYFYVSTDQIVDNIIAENEDFIEWKKEIIEQNEVDDDLLKIPDNIFIIGSCCNDQYFVLTDSKKHNDSPVYVYKNEGAVAKANSSVWEWIDEIVTNSFDGDRNNISPFWLDGYRKPEYKDTGEVIIHKSRQNLDIVRPFFEGGRNQKSRYWLETYERLHRKKQAEA